MKNKKCTGILMIAMTAVFQMTSVLSSAGLLSSSGKLAENTALISAVPSDAKAERNSGNRILSAPNIDENEDENNLALLSYHYNNLIADDDIFDFTNISLNIESFDITASKPLSDSETLHPMDYTYRLGMCETYIKLNNDAAAIINRYMEQAQYIPVKDPLWFLAIGAVEYNYRENESDVIFSWPVDTYAARANPDYLLHYNWHEVQRIGGNDLVTRRSGGAIGPFQLESFFGAGTEPLIPEEFGLIGSADGQTRTDCWLELGANPGSGTDIIWKQGTYADRWSIADAANQTLAVYNETIRRAGRTELDNLPDRYAKATLLMWTHNRGTGLLGQESARKSVEIIMSRKDELEQLVWQHRPSRFARQGYFMDKALEISDQAGCDAYPIMALISYLIVESRYAGHW